jgi:hypothetical protein
MGRIDIPAAVEEEFNDWYNIVCIPTYLTVPGVLRARRFVAIEGQPKYLTLYEFEHAQVPESEAWSKARASNPWTRRMSPNLRHDVGSPGSTGASSRSSCRVAGYGPPPCRADTLAGLRVFRRGRLL